MKIRSIILNRHRAASATTAAALAFAVAPSASAANCSDHAHSVYVAGSSASKPFLQQVAKELLAEATPIQLVYQGQGSCVGVGYMPTAESTATGTITGTGVVWDATGTEGTCDLDFAGNEVDIGISDVYASTCQQTPLASDVKDFLGPVQSMTFAVPVTSTATSISAEAAYLVYGFGAGSNTVAPWTDASVILQRSATSGTQSMIAAAINVSPGVWLPAANTNAGSGDIVNKLVDAAANNKADAAIGILASDVVIKNPTKVKSLAYQHYGQECGYWPDSTANSKDKANVRDGQYMIWGPLHLFSKTTGGEPVNADAKAVKNFLSNASLDLIHVEAVTGVVPDCAMRVQRSGEVGALSSYMPAVSCECRFVFETTGAVPAECGTCTSSTDCPDGRKACNYGYCEVQ